MAKNPISIINPLIKAFVGMTMIDLTSNMLPVLGQKFGGQQGQLVTQVAGLGIQLGKIAIIQNLLGKINLGKGGFIKPLILGVLNIGTVTTVMKQVPSLIQTFQGMSNGGNGSFLSPLQQQQGLR